MKKADREEVWGLLDTVAGQVMFWRDNVDTLVLTAKRQELVEEIIEMRDRLSQVSERVERTIKVKA